MSSTSIRTPLSGPPIVCAALAVISGLLLFPHETRAAIEDARWIWAPARRGAANTCYFRKTFAVSGDATASVDITCDEAYELYVNGVRVGSDDNWESIDTHLITPYLVPGRNAVTVVARKSQSGPAGLLAEVDLRTADGSRRSLRTDSSWKVNLRATSGWQRPGFNDSRWARARSLGAFGETQPWASVAKAAKQEQNARFRVDREFRVEWMVRPEDTGSLLAFEFNEFGHIVASQEKGPLLLIRDTNNDGVHDKVSTYCEEIQNCQGILPLNGSIYATGDGPEGLALYRLSDTDRDGVADEVQALVKFGGKAGEHGPHAVRLGPDGLIYLVVGNHTELVDEPRPTSPYRDFVEGDLVQPRLEDPDGYARGRPAPGGMILRTDTNGSFVERFSGGLRNPYDIVFNAKGDLVTADSDMEWDDGLPWYRPTRLSLLTAGSEHGWRSGWAKWPEYFVDSVPPIYEMGPGSPAGMASYDHIMFPVRFHNAVFVGDWARGQIRALSLEQDGAAYKATSRVFVEGSPLNVTDLAVGPDGALYFSTGGRGTEGGIYRVVWLGRVPEEVRNRGDGIEAALNQPQPASAWGRQEVATIKKQLGNLWGSELAEVASDRRRQPAERVRALELMQLYGPFPTEDLLVALSQDRSAEIRAASAFFMGLHEGPATTSRLIELLEDSSRRVARLSCEALARLGEPAPVASLTPLLASQDPFLATAAGTVLKQAPVDQWRDDIVEAKDLRAFLVGSSVLLSQSPDKETSLAILDRCGKIMGGFVSDDDFIDLLRVCQLGLLHSQFTAEEVPQLADRLASEFPAGDYRMNRELVRLLAYFSAREPSERYLDFLRGEAPLAEKIHLALHAPALIGSWSTADRFEVLQFIEKTREDIGSASYGRYVDQVSRAFVENMSPVERSRVLRQGRRWPSAALGTLAKLPKEIPASTRDELIALDKELSELDSREATRLRTGIVAVLARNGDEESMHHLRELFEAEPDRRDVIAVGLAQDPHGDNWPLLVRSLAILEGKFAAAVLVKLNEVDRQPETATEIRQVILLGLKQTNDGGRRQAIELLKHWTGHETQNAEAPPVEQLAAWQSWFRENYPLEPDPVVPQDASGARYTFSELYKLINDDDQPEGNLEQGRLAYQAAKCASCHRFGREGEDIGPDLTTISRRFHNKEILEAIVYPSHVISDRYATQTVITVDGQTYTGIVQLADDEHIEVLQSDGEKVSLSKSEVEELAPNKTSIMPSGLLDTLSEQQVVDLFHYLSSAPDKSSPRGRLSERPAEQRR
ncbi:MAG: heme-binding protein [Planctomycetota bacterium]|nr:MAG: heme-binding protein [Planctomycetota bacterium]REK25754.1 MAG: heme-binding protein [Planctomycetota bacterium]REK46498.1 MAG: heme-binding protein [Planctomycetota bacterium]